MNFLHLLNNSYGVEIECYLPEGGSAAELATAINSESTPCVAESYSRIVREHWKIISNGSLGDYNRGIEIVSPSMHGTEGMVAIDHVMVSLREYGCTVGKLCGLHVHVGVSANDGYLKALKYLYAAYEPIIDGFMPPSRRANKNAFCRSMISAADVPDDRYRKLNIFASYERHRTVEFRHHGGTLDSDKAKYWLLFCLRMVDTARADKAATPITLEGLFDRLESTEGERMYFRSRTAEMVTRSA